MKKIIPQWIILASVLMCHEAGAVEPSKNGVWHIAAGEALPLQLSVSGDFVTGELFLADAVRARRDLWMRRGEAKQMLFSVDGVTFAPLTTLITAALRTGWALDGPREGSFNVDFDLLER